jgi:hypothetical protein
VQAAERRGQPAGAKRKVVAGVIDTHDAWHRARTASPAPVKAEPVGPTDAEVVASGEPTHRWEAAENLRRVVCLRCARHVPMDKVAADGAAAAEGLVGDCWDGFRAWANRRDAEIVAAYERWQSNETGLRSGENQMVLVRTSPPCLSVPLHECRAAWSRVLAAKVQASAERERLTVLGPIDDPEEA